MSKIKGMDALQANLKHLEKSAGRHVKSAHIAGGKLVEGSAKKSIQDPSVGTYVVRYRNGEEGGGGNGYQHIASAPNDAPNTDTGALVRSISTEVEPEWVVVGTTLKYGKWLEFGTKRMDARPWLIPALDANNDKILELYLAAMNKSIKEIGNIV